MQLSTLRPLYERPGPWASVYLDASRDTEDAVKAIELRWRAAREVLERAGCDAATLGALEASVATQRDQPGHGLALFASQGAVALRHPIDAPPRRPLARLAALPHVMPLVAQLGHQIPYLRVVVDHTGGDIEAAGAGRLVRHYTVDGSADYPIRKVKAGGWSQSHHQRAADEAWRRNAGVLASAVAELADRYAAEVIVVAGVPQSRPMLIAQLPDRWRERVVEADVGARGAGADPAALDDVTIMAVAQRAAAREEDILDRYRTQQGHDAAAASGLAAVVAALQRGQVDTVLLVDDPSSSDELWIGPGPLELSFDRAELVAMGVTDPERVRADAALVRAIVGTDADLILVLPDELDLEGGVAALLRYADAATRRR
jgi:hypothetical protein